MFDTQFNHALREATAGLTQEQRAKVVLCFAKEVSELMEITSGERLEPVADRLTGLSTVLMAMIAEEGCFAPEG